MQALMYANNDTSVINAKANDISNVNTANGTLEVSSSTIRHLVLPNVMIIGAQKAGTTSVKLCSRL